MSYHHYDATFSILITFSDLMVDCWSEIPENRPDFGTIRNRLKRLKQGMKTNIMDQMIDMLEKYSNNLEVKLVFLFLKNNVYNIDTARSV